MSKGIIETIGGAALATAGLTLEIFGGPVGKAIGGLLVTAGAGLVLSGIGTLLTKGPLNGAATATLNPVSPWRVVYGQARVGGDVVYRNLWGEGNKYLDLVVLLADHPCKSIDEVLFDNQRLQIGAHNTSFTPLQQKIPITRIVRVGNVVTVYLNQNIPLASDGDQVIVENVHPVSANLNGKFPITIISQAFGGPGSLVFTYLSGGTAIDIPSFGGSESGDCRTAWPDYRANVYVEALLGTQTLGQTFMGMTNGTPAGGDTGNMVGPSPNQWTNFHSLVGKTAMFIRLQYEAAVFPGGVPQISVHMSGKNDIYDPRTDTNIYTENAALTIADFLSNQTWGFKAAYHTEIPDAQLIAAANICDEQVPLAEPPVSPPATESRYACNGAFQISMKRAEILQNLLTSCAGRLTYTGGQFAIWPGAWAGVSATLAPSFIPSNAAGSFKWRPTVSISNLYNGVKGTYVSPVNNWQASDFPWYAQDTTHGYSFAGPQGDANLAADGGDRRWKDVQFPFTISCPTAQRLAKIELMRIRQQGTGSFILNMAGYQFAPLDVIATSLTYFGWSGKLLEIASVRFTPTKQTGGASEATLLGTEIDVQETDPSVYAWNIGEELSPAGYQQAITQDDKTPQPPTNLAIVGGEILTWTAPNDGYVLSGGHIDARYMQVLSPPGLWISLGRLDPSITQLELPDLTAGAQFIVQLRSVNAAGVDGDWVSIETVGRPELQWAPHQVQAPSDDALFPDEWSFDPAQSYLTLADGSAQATASLTGKFPPNAGIPHCPAPLLAAANITQAPTGGLLPGGVTLYVSIAANDADGNTSPASERVAFQIAAGTNTNLLTLADAFASITGVFSVNPFNASYLSIAGKIYHFQTTLTNVDGNVKIGANLAATLSNLAAAVNLGAGSGSLYAAATVMNPAAGAIASAAAILCTALTAGAAGNLLTASGLAIWSGDGNFSGGASLTWPAVMGLVSYTVYASTEQDLVCAQETAALSSGSPPTTVYTPTSFTFGASALQRSTLAVPDETVELVRVKGKLLIHGGVEGAPADSVTSTTIVASELADLASPPIDNWAGRALAVIGRNNGSAPFMAFNCTAFDPSTGTFTVSQNPLGAGSPPVGMLAGDTFVVCTLGNDNSGNPFVVTDAGLSNATDLDIDGNPAPHAGLVPSNPKYIGAILRVIAGKSRGQLAKIVDNGTTSFTLAAPIVMDATSVWIVEYATWQYQVDSNPLANMNPELAVTVAMPVTNFLKKSMVIGGFTADQNDSESLEGNAPFRMLYVFGAPGQIGPGVIANEATVSY